MQHLRQRSANRVIANVFLYCFMYTACNVRIFSDHAMHSTDPKLSSSCFKSTSYLVHSWKSSLHGVCSSFCLQSPTTSWAMSGRWAADYMGKKSMRDREEKQEEGLIENSVLFQRSNIYSVQEFCRVTCTHECQNRCVGINGVNIYPVIKICV